MSLSIRPLCARVYTAGPPAPGSVVPSGDGAVLVRLMCWLALFKEKKMEKETDNAVSILEVLS